jgi:hypothetical protein
MTDEPKRTTIRGSAGSVFVFEGGGAGDQEIRSAVPDAATTIRSVCTIVMTLPGVGAEWTPETWAENIHDCLLDAIGYPERVTVDVKTISMEIVRHDC